MSKYRKKPVVIEAFKYDGDLINSKGEFYVPKWAERAFRAKVLFYADERLWRLKGENPWELYVKTLEGDQHVSVGDYVIKGVKGEIYPCKPDIFAMTYEEEPEDE